MITKEFVFQKREEIKRTAKKHGAYDVRIFGSVARGEQNSGSDLDVLIEVGPNTSSWFPAGLIADLESVLGCRVEVVTQRGLNPEIKETVLKEAVAL